MPASVNMAIIIGNLGADPDVKEVNDTKVANLSVATNESYKNKDGERVEKTEWHRVTVWGPLAGVVEKYCHKGSSVYVQGQIRTRKYTKDDGIERYATEIVLSGPQAVLRLNDAKGGGDSGSKSDESTASTQTADDLDDDIPF